MYHSNRLGFFMIGCGMAEGLMVLIMLGLAWSIMGVIMGAFVLKASPLSGVDQPPLTGCSG